MASTGGMPARGLFLCADRRGRLPAIHLRHLDIHQDRVEGGPRQRGQRLPPIVGHGNPVALLFEQTDCYFLVYFVVFRQKQIQASQRGGLPQFVTSHQWLLFYLCRPGAANRFEQICVVQGFGEIRGDA